MRFDKEWLNFFKNIKTMNQYKIPFNKPNFDINALAYIKDVIDIGHTSGDGKYTALCSNFIKKKFAIKSCLITHSCTASLEMSAFMLNAKQGDEIIMPSYSFVSTANAFVLRGLTPVFIDIRSDNCNIDESLFESAITKKTKAIVVVHYGGIACEMDKIIAIAKKYNLLVIEDSAQAFDSKYKNKYLGTIGDIGCFSFHETKNIISGEGGAFLTNNEDFIDRAHIIREKGTDRTKFLKGLVDKYSWVEAGSSYLPSDLISAFLFSNLEISEKIKQRRMEIWSKYYKIFEPFMLKEKIKLPSITEDCQHNAHLFYLRFKNESTRDSFIYHMKENGILTPFHYVALHSSKAGKKYSRAYGSMKNTDEVSKTLVRLPIFYNLQDFEQDIIIDKTIKFLND